MHLVSSSTMRMATLGLFLSLGHTLPTNQTHWDGSQHTSVIAKRNPFATVFGFFAGALGVVSFFEAHIPKAVPKGSTIKITLGMDHPPNTAGEGDPGLSGAGGDWADFVLWDDNGDFLGRLKGDTKLNHGETGDLFVKQSAPRQAPYTMIRAHNDAICIATAAITFANGIDSYGWVGDWAPICGKPWAFSKIYAFNRDYSPKCMWLDKDRSVADFPTALGIHWPDYDGSNGIAESVLASEEKKEKYKDYICNSGVPFQAPRDDVPTKLFMWQNKISFADWEKLKEKEKKETLSNSLLATAQAGDGYVQDNLLVGYSNKTRASGYRFSGQLIVTDAVQHSMEEICNDDFSAGPDYVNVLEGKFCRMSDKTLYRVCNDSIGAGCFDLGTKQLLNEDKLVDRAHIPYHFIQDWAAEVKSS